MGPHDTPEFGNTQKIRHRLNCKGSAKLLEIYHSIHSVIRCEGRGICATTRGGHPAKKSDFTSEPARKQADAPGRSGRRRSEEVEKKEESRGRCGLESRLGPRPP